MQPRPMADTVRSRSCRCFMREDSSQPDARYAHRSMRIAPEVAEAVAGGRPVVALESTLISHGLPRPRNLAVAREMEAEVRAAGAVPATIAVVGGRGARSGWTRPRSRRSPPRRRGQVRRARPGGRWRRAAGTVRPPWRPRRTWPRERASACSPPAGSAACTARRARPGTSRPTWRRWRASAIARGLRGGEVDPRRGRDARAAGDPRRDRARLRHRRASPASTCTTRASRCRGGSTRRPRSRR